MAIILRLDRVMADRKISLNELASRVGISNVNLSNLKTGKVKSFTWCCAGNGIHCEFFTDRSKDNMFISRAYQVKMNFVRYDQNMVFHTDPANALELFPAPYAAAWIMRAAENQKLCVGVFGFCLEIIEINFVSITSAD